MSVLFVAGSQHRVETSITPDNRPRSYSIWHKQNGGYDGFQWPLFEVESTDGRLYAGHFISSTTRVNRVQEGSVTQGTDFVDTVATTTDVWNNTCLIFGSTTDRRILVNGGNKATNTGVTGSRLSINLLNLGAGSTAAVPLAWQYYFDGLIGDVTMYDGILSDQDCLDIYNGEDPEPLGGGAIHRWKLDGNYNDSIGSLTMTPINSPTFSGDNPPSLDGGPGGTTTGRSRMGLGLGLGL